MRTTWMALVALAGASAVGAQQRPVRPPVPDTSRVAPGAGRGTGTAPRVDRGQPGIAPLPPSGWGGFYLGGLGSLSNLPGQGFDALDNLADLPGHVFGSLGDFSDLSGYDFGLSLPGFQGGQGVQGSGWAQGTSDALRALRNRLEDMRLQQFDLQQNLQLDALNQQLQSLDLQHNLAWGLTSSGTVLSERMPAPYAQGDVADSVYRSAREMVNRGDWRMAAQTLRALPQRYPNSAYVADALYWQAFSLYRIGTTTDLRQALTALDALRDKYPNARTQADASTLSMRIMGALADRGDAQARADLARAAAQNPQGCDRDQQAVQIEAMNALNRTDPENMSGLLDKVLARTDACSVPLRHGAVFLIGNKRDAGSVALLARVAKNDPSGDVRVAAIDWLGRIPSEDGLSTLEELTRSSDSENVQRAAIRALVAHPSARARQLVRSIVEREDVPERLRAEALSAFDRDGTSAEDVVWLRGVYAKLTNSRLKQRALSAITRVGGSDVDQWLAGIVRNEDESSDLRAIALRRIGKSMSVADLGKLYDEASARIVREQLISIFGDRKEPEATDKLIDIVKKGTDPNLQRRAISALSSKNDPRTTALLLEIINK